MAKNTHAQEAATGTPDSYTAHESSDADAPIVIRRAMLGEVDRPSQGPRDGGGFSPSTEKPQTSTESSKDSPPQPAPTTENPSDQQEKEEDSIAPLTDGDTQRMEQPPSDEGETDLNEEEDSEPDFDTRAKPTPPRKPVPAKKTASATKKAATRSTDFDDDDF